MQRNLGRGSILCPHGAFAILGGNDDHDGELSPGCQEDTADLHLLFRCELEGGLNKLTPLPRHPLLLPSPPTVPTTESLQHPPHGVSDERDTASASIRQGGKLPVWAQSRIFHCLASWSGFRACTS